MIIYRCDHCRSIEEYLYEISLGSKRELLGGLCKNCINKLIKEYFPIVHEGLNSDTKLNKEVESDLPF